MAVKVGLLGDTHGNHAWIKGAARVFESHGIDTVIQVGDLGVDSSMKAAKQWDTTNRYLVSRGITMLVAPGNHEDYDYIDTMRPREDGWLHYRSNILLAPRGLRTEMGGRSFVWLGGAGSVDRSIRERWHAETGRRYWWPQEAITEEDVERTVAGGLADIMVSHDAPAGVPEIDLPLVRTAHQWESSDLAYAHACRKMFTVAVTKVQPDLLLHGHYHFGVRGCWRSPGTDHETRVFGLGADLDAENGLGILYTETLHVEHLPDSSDHGRRTL